MRTPRSLLARTAALALATTSLAAPTRPAAAQQAQRAPQAARAPLPRVHVVATGGTIASTNYYSEQQGKTSIAALLGTVPALDTVATLTSEQFANVGSSAITTAMWLSLARGIADTLRARADLAGVVVTHGTDTMEETAYFLDRTVADARPVVVTGAMRPADGVGIDGPANLLNAVRVAASPASRGYGAMILMNDEILGARDATKANTARPDAFVTRSRGALGVADPEGVVFYRAPARPPVFDLARVRELPRVDVVYSYVGADSAVVDALVAAGAKGIVVAATGRGSIPPMQRAALNRALAKGVVVVVGSRTGSGSVPIDSWLGRATGTTPALIGTGDLDVQKARVLLMLALTRTSDPREVARIFREHQ